MSRAQSAHCTSLQTAELSASLKADGRTVAFLRLLALLVTTMAERGAPKTVFNELPPVVRWRLRHAAAAGRICSG